MRKEESIEYVSAMRKSYQLNGKPAMDLIKIDDTDINEVGYVVIYCGDMDTAKWVKQLKFGIPEYPTTLKSSSMMSKVDAWEDRRFWFVNVRNPTNSAISTHSCVMETLVW